MFERAVASAEPGVPSPAQVERSCYHLAVCFSLAYQDMVAMADAGEAFAAALIQARPPVYPRSDGRVT